MGLGLLYHESLFKDFYNPEIAIQADSLAGIAVKSKTRQYRCTIKDSMGVALEQAHYLQRVRNHPFQFWQAHRKHEH